MMERSQTTGRGPRGLEDPVIPSRGGHPLLAPPEERSDLGLILWALSRAEAELRCRHFVSGRAVMPRVYGCERCLDLGALWKGLRLCRSCGHVGCCENSRHQHADRHFSKTGHPIVASLDPTRRWSFCYIDRIRVFA
jgi:hypothetical protein